APAPKAERASHAVPKFLRRPWPSRGRGGAGGRPAGFTLSASDPSFTVSTCAWSRGHGIACSAPRPGQDVILTVSGSAGGNSRGWGGRHVPADRTPFGGRHA